MRAFVKNENFESTVSSLERQVSEDFFVVKVLYKLYKKIGRFCGISKIFLVIFLKSHRTSVFF